MPIEDYRPSELEPQRLSKEEIENPFQVIESFFESGHIPQIREAMWELFKTLITSSYSKTLTRREQSDMVYFFELLQKLVEASHLLYKEKRKEIASNFSS